VNYRSRQFLDLCYQFPCMLLLPCCEGGDAGEPCHSNQSIHGKGGALKAHDCFVVPGCRSCHRELDQGRTMTREEKAAAWNRAYWQFLAELFLLGHLEVKS